MRCALRCMLGHAWCMVHARPRMVHARPRLVSDGKLSRPAGRSQRCLLAHPQAGRRQLGAGQHAIIDVAQHAIINVARHAGLGVQWPARNQRCAPVCDHRCRVSEDTPLVMHCQTVRIEAGARARAAAWLGLHFLQVCGQVA